MGRVPPSLHCCPAVFPPVHPRRCDGADRGSSFGKRFHPTPILFLGCSPWVHRRLPAPAPSPGVGGRAPGRMMLTRFSRFRCQRWAAGAARSPQRLCLRLTRKRVDSLTPGAITRSTRMASSLAGLAAFLQRAGTLLPRKPCPDLCRRACFHLAPAPFRPRCSSSKAALGVCA